MRNNTKKRPSELLIGVLLIGIVAGAVIAIGVDGRFTNNQKVQCLTLAGGICTVQIQTGTSTFQFVAGQNKVCNLVTYGSPLPPKPYNITFSFSQPHLGEMIFPVGELPVQGLNGLNTTDVFQTGGSGSSPLLVPGLPVYFKFMPQTAWIGVDTSIFQISMLEYDNTAVDGSLNPLGSLQIWAQFFPTTGSFFNGYAPQVGAQWHNLTSFMTPDNITSIPPNYPLGFESQTVQQSAGNTPVTPMLLRLVYANNFGGAVPETIIFSDLKISLYGTTVLVPNIVFAHATNMDLCLVGAEANAFTPFAFTADVQWTLTIACRYSTFTQGTPNTVSSFTQC